MRPCLSLLQTQIWIPTHTHTHTHTLPIPYPYPQVWRIDVALSAAMGGGAIEALEVDDKGGVHVLTQRGGRVEGARRRARSRRSGAG